MAREKLTRTKILMSIFITSAFWLALDMYIFYGFYPLENIARKENLVIKPKMIVNIVTENIDNIEDDTVKDDTTWEEVKKFFSFILY